MKEAGVIDEEIFALCLGKNGGRFTVGGYDESLALPGHEMQWFKVPLGGYYKVPLDGIHVGENFLPGS